MVGAVLSLGYANPRWWGAACNNSGDDSLAGLEAAAAINSASGGGGGIVRVDNCVLSVVAQGLNFDANAITAASWSGGTITFTTTRNHGILPGELFLITGMTPSGYNGFFTAASGTTGTTLKAAASNPGTETGLGQIPASAGQLYGSNRGSSQIVNNGFAGQTVTLNASLSAIKDVTVQGYNNIAAGSSTYAAIYIGSNCGACTVDDSETLFGGGLWFAGTDDIFSNVSAKFSYAAGAITNTGTGLRMYTVATDSNAPGLSLSQGIASPSNWAANTSYTAGTIVIDSGFVLQAMTSGTSGSGSAPTVLPYFQTITDGTVTWQTMQPNPSAGIECTAGGALTDVAGDHSGYYSYGIHVNGCANVTISGLTVIAAELIAPVFLQSGSTVNITDSLLQGCTITGCAQLNVGPSFSGELHTKGNFINGTPANTRGILLQGGVNSSFVGDNLTGNLYGLFVTAGVSKWNILGAQAGASSVYGTSAVGVNVASGSSDDYEIIGVNCRDATSACIADAGTGTHKTVFGNDGSAGTIAGAFSWLGTLTFADSGTWGSGGINGSNIGTTTPRTGQFTTLNYTSALQHNGTAVQCSDLSNAGALCPVTPGTGVAAALRQSGEHQRRHSDRKPIAHLRRLGIRHADLQYYGVPVHVQTRRPDKRLAVLSRSAGLQEISTSIRPTVQASGNRSP